MRAALLVIFLLQASATMATEIVLSAPGGDGWRVLNFPRIQRHTTYTSVHVDGMDATKADGECAASALYLPLDELDLSKTPRLQWRWKIAAALTVPNERINAGDDFAARVSVMFRFDAAHASLWERVTHGLGTRLYGDTVPGHAIEYVWSSHEPARATWESPYSAASRLKALRTQPVAEWASETVDVAADYAAFFGHEPPPVIAVGLMTDSDDTCQHATAYYADFRFVGP